MKIDFKKAAQAARERVKASTFVYAMAGADLVMSGARAFDYYQDSPERDAYTHCVEEQSVCSPEQMAMVKQHIDTGMSIPFSLVAAPTLLLMGLGYRKDEKYRETLKKVQKLADTHMDGYVKELGRRIELEDRLQKAEAQLAPYLADEKRKAGEAAVTAARQELNQMAEDATTLQGEIKPARKIRIKPRV